MSNARFCALPATQRHLSVIMKKRQSAQTGKWTQATSPLKLEAFEAQGLIEGFGVSGDFGRSCSEDHNWSMPITYQPAYGTHLHEGFVEALQIFHATCRRGFRACRVRGFSMKVEGLGSGFYRTLPPKP